MWVENVGFCKIVHMLFRHPPCEDVSWKIVITVLLPVPMLSSSLWGCELKNQDVCTPSGYHCHPPCEDVSWKYTGFFKCIFKFSSSSLWGCELKNRMPLGGIRWPRHPPCEDVSWKNEACMNIIIHLVILLVRMWVEKVLIHHLCRISLSSSMWGCELKNEAKDDSGKAVKSSSMWGCELKREWCKNVWYSSIALFMRKIVPSNDMNSIYVMRKRGELKEYKLQFLSIKKGLHY